MPVVALIDPDGALQRELERHLLAEGWSVVRFERLRSLIHRGSSDPPALVLLSADGDAERARAMTRELRTSDLDSALGWYLRGKGPAVVQRVEQPDVILHGPADRLSVRSMLWRAIRQARVHDAWSGRDFLTAVSGALQRYPPFRLLFLAHRVRASGQLSIHAGSDQARIRFQSGGIVGVSGLPELLAPLNVAGGPRDTMSDLLATAIRGGTSPDLALETAAIELGCWLARAIDAEKGRVEYLPPDDGEPPIPLTMPIPQMLARALRQVRPFDVVLQDWRAHWSDRVEPRPPDDAPDSRWGLDPVALRLLRRATGDTTLESLVGKEHKEDAVLAADLLIQLGIVQLVGSPPDDSESDREAPAAPVPEDAGVAASDERIAAMEKAIEEFAAADPVEALGITRSSDLTPAGIERAFRQRSGHFHPDTITSGGERLKQLAAVCFGLLVEARDMLDDEDVRREWTARLRAAEEGRQFVGDDDRRVAQMSSAEGDVAFKQRRWTEARRAFEASLEREPNQWRARYMLAIASWRDGSRPPMQVLGDLEALEVPDGLPKADLFNACGEIALAEGHESRAFRFFERAVNEFPEHVDARRRLRLRRMRRAGSSDISQPSNGPSGDGFFGGLLKRTKK